jgi:hypothetical protein
MPKNRQLARLEESIRVYEQVIRSFEHANEQMRQRRRSASDSVMVHIDDSLALNRRALDSLNRILESARKQLRQERSRAGPD